METAIPEARPPCFRKRCAGFDKLTGLTIVISLFMVIFLSSSEWASYLLRAFAGVHSFGGTTVVTLSSKKNLETLLGFWKSFVRDSELRRTNRGQRDKRLESGAATTLVPAPPAYLGHTEVTCHNCVVVSFDSVINSSVGDLSVTVSSRRG